MSRVTAKGQVTIPVTVRLEPQRALITTSGGPGVAFDVSELVERGLRAELQVQSFVTGQSQIDLDFAPNTPVALHPGVTGLPEIPARQSAFQRAREQFSQLPLRDLSDNAVATLQGLRTLSDKLEHDLPPLIESLKITSDRTADTLANAEPSPAEPAVARRTASTGLRSAWSYAMPKKSHTR